METIDIKLCGLDVHIWRVFLPAFESQKVWLEKLLSPEQVERGKRIIRFPEKLNYTIRSAIIRLLIGKYLDISPLTVEFVASRLGKPAICATGIELGLEFNVSHSEDWLFLAFCRDNPIGVDVECVKHDFPVMEISQRFFTSSEASLVANVNEKCRTEMFFRIWVRKEAYLKALGKGLYLDLKSFETPIAPQVDCVEGNDNSGCTCVGTLDGRWYFYDISTISGYCACLVTDFKPSAFNLFDLNSPESLKSFQLSE